MEKELHFKSIWTLFDPSGVLAIRGEVPFVCGMPHAWTWFAHELRIRGDDGTDDPLKTHTLWCLFVIVKIIFSATDYRAVRTICWILVVMESVMTVLHLA